MASGTARASWLPTLMLSPSGGSRLLQRVSDDRTGQDKTGQDRRDFRLNSAQARHRAEEGCWDAACLGPCLSPGLHFLLSSFRVSMHL